MTSYHGPSVGAGPAPAGKPLHIGDAARRMGVSASALRLWERQGLVRPSRSPAGYRLYGEGDITRLRAIRDMREAQVSAPGILRMLPATGATPEPRPERRLDGQLLRRARLRCGLSLLAASQRGGVSVSFLSSLERNVSGASLATLQRLTAVYGSTVQELMDPPGLRSSHRPLRPRQRPRLELQDGVRIEQLARGARQLEPQLFVLAPRASSAGTYAHVGEEFVFVLDGELTFWIGERERYRLRTGDALTFPSNLPHRWRNRAGGETRLLWINTPPTF
jgi:DNA-binding transcriptional MerR regulator